MKNVFILNYKRTPIGSYNSILTNFSAVDLGNMVLKELLKESKIDKKEIDKCYVGNVYSTGLGQNIARQIVYYNNINCPAITINQVCGSGMQAIFEGFNSIVGGANCVIVGGVESMSNAPLYIKNNDKKKYKTLIIDGLMDAFTKKTMGMITEECISILGYSREEFDEYTLNSYRKARDSYNNNKFKDEIIKIEIKERVIEKDEEVDRKNLNNLKNLKSAFTKNGILTAGNSSNLSDGAAMMILVSEEFIKKYNIEPVAQILGYNSIVDIPNNFIIINTKCIKDCAIKLDIDLKDIDCFELNEGYPIVPLHTHKNLNISLEKINVLGGALALGHPIGCSGTRIVGTLITALKDKKGKIGCASINYGGGGASSLILKIF